jgi:hypothetical protein
VHEYVMAGSEGVPLEQDHDCRCPCWSSVGWPASVRAPLVVAGHAHRSSTVMERVAVSVRGREAAFAPVPCELRRTFVSQGSR